MHFPRALQTLTNSFPEQGGHKKIAQGHQLPTTFCETLKRMWGVVSGTSMVILLNTVRSTTTQINLVTGNACHCIFV